MIKISSKASRIGWIDATKGIAILLIMCGHVSQPNPTSKWYGTFYVAVFLVIAGFMNGKKSKINLSLTTVRKNLIPYFWFSIAAIVVRCLYCVLKAPNELISSFADYLYRAVVGYGILALWFIPSYLIGQFIFFAIIKIKNTWIRSFLIILLPVSAFGTEKILLIVEAGTSSLAYNLIYYPVASVFRGLACGLYIYTGYLLYFVYEKYSEKLSGGGYICLSIVVLAALFPLAQLNKDSNFSTLKYGSHSILLYVCGIFGSMALMGLCYGIYRYCSLRFLEFCGRNSLILMGTHMSLMLTSISLKIVSVINDYLFGGAINAYICSVICTAIMLIIEYPIILLLNGKLRFFMTGKLTRKGKTSDE